MSMMMALMTASLSHMASVTGIEGDMCTICMCVMLMKGLVVSMCGGGWVIILEFRVRSYGVGLVSRSCVFVVRC